MDNNHHSIDQPSGRTPESFLGWGGLVALFVSTLIALLDRDSHGMTTVSAPLLTVLTAVYAFLMPLYLGMREGRLEANSGDKGQVANSHVMTFSPASTWGQIAYVGTYAAIAMLMLPPVTRLSFVTLTTGPWLAVIPILGANLLPVAAMEVYLFRTWGGFPPEREFRRLMPRALILGFLMNFLWCFFLTPFASDAHLFLLFLTPIAYGTVVLRYRTARRWQKLVDVQTEKAEAAEHARQIAEMQLSVLQAQIEPHFLYNTLASVQYLIRKDSKGADLMLAHLIRYLRSAMPKMRMAMSTLGQEFELADAYLQIASLRMGERLSVKVEISDDLRSLEFPPMVIQTLVENALKHGVEPKSGPVTIEVHAEYAEGVLVVKVEDTGLGLGMAQTSGSGTGLTNIRSRLKAIYGETAHLTVADCPTGGVSSVVRVTVGD